MHKGICGQSEGGATCPRNTFPEQTLADYIQRRYREEAFNNVKAEKPKLTFEEWLRQSSFVEPDAGTKIWLQDCWKAAQENCR